MTFDDSLLKRFWEKVRKSEGCWEWTACQDRSGYGWFRIGGRRSRAHRFSYELHFGPIPYGLHVLHRCDNPPCVNPEHLWVGTNADNMADMRLKGRNHVFRNWGNKGNTGPRARDHSGEGNPRSKLRAEDVRAIRDRYQNGETQASLAAEYNVHFTTVNQLCTGRTWKSV